MKMYGWTGKSNPGLLGEDNSVCSNEGPCPLSKGDDSYIVKIH